MLLTPAHYTINIFPSIGQSVPCLFGQMDMSHGVSLVKVEVSYPGVVTWNPYTLSKPFLEIDDIIATGFSLQQIVPCIHPSIKPTHLYIHPSVRSSIHPSIHPAIYPSNSFPSIHLSTAIN